jgi:RNA polymerase sigma-70 factor (ECF subfamily)
MNITNKVLNDFLVGDMQAFQQIYEQSKSFVYNTIYKMVLRKQEAEDLMHDVYVKVYEKREMYNKEFSINTWINRIAVNHVLNHLKRQNNFLRKVQDIKFFYEQNFSEETDVEEEGKAYSLLKKIKPKYRLPIVLKDIQELSYEEVAKTLNLPIGTVRSRLNRGRRKLRELYEKEVSDEK